MEERREGDRLPGGWPGRRPKPYIEGPEVAGGGSGGSSWGVWVLAEGLQ